MPKPSEKRLLHLHSLVAYDAAFDGFGTTLAGMDEAGRGPLMGPVVAACVILPREPVLEWVDDSKRLSAARREEMERRIREVGRRRLTDGTSWALRASPCAARRPLPRRRCASWTL